MASRLIIELNVYLNLFKFVLDVTRVSRVERPQ